MQELGPDKDQLVGSLEQFIRDERLILLAEAQIQSIDELRQLQLYFSLPRGSAGGPIKYEGKIDLYLFAPGHLLGLEKPLSLPIHYSGTITMLNDGLRGPVRDRAVDAQIADLNKPLVELITDVPTSNELQVIATLTKGTIGSLPIFHDGDKPKIKYDIKYHSFAPSWTQQVEWESIRQYLTSDSFKDGQIYLQVPSNLTEQVEVNIPHPEFYPIDPYMKLLENSDESRRYIQERRERRPPIWETKYFYKVTYREADPR